MVVVRLFGNYSYENTLFFHLVEFDEFVRVMKSVYQRKFSDEEMRRAFQCFDTDGSGR